MPSIKLQFQGMTVNPITLDELNHTREKLIMQLLSDLIKNEKKFIV